jgi:hypothetical protein
MNPMIPTKPTRLLLSLTLGFSLAGLLGCKSPSRSHPPEETIVAYEVILITATNHNAEAVADLALVIDYNGAPQPSRQTHEFPRKQYDRGERKVVKVKTSAKIPWKNRNKITFYLSTRSQDGYLPSRIWIAAVSNEGNRFVMRNVDWKNKMFSSETDEPEAELPIRSAREWVISHDD